MRVTISMEEEIGEMEGKEGALAFMCQLKVIIKRY